MWNDIGKSTVAIIFIDHVLSKVIGQVEIHVSSVKEIAGTDIQGPAPVIDPQFWGDIGKGAIAIVTIEDVGAAVASAFKVVVHNMCCGEMPEIILWAKVITDIEIEQAISVIVKPDCSVAIPAIACA